MPELIGIVLVILGAFLFKYRDSVQEAMRNPVLVFIFLLGAGVLIFVIFIFGHYLEKVFNRINMWRQGINGSDKHDVVRFSFINFDLKKLLEKFYQQDVNKEQTFIGMNAEKSNKEIVSIPDIQRTQHLQVLGMTGTGKTTGVFLPLIYQDALKNRPIIIIDAKGEMEVINQLYSILEASGCAEKFMLFSLTHKDISCTYNPLYSEGVDPQIVIDAFFNNFEDENSFFREMSKAIFTNTFYILHSFAKPFTPMDVYCYLNNEACRQEMNKKVTRNNKQGTLYLKMFNQIISDLTEQYRGWKHAISGFNNFLLSHGDALLNEDDSDIVLMEAILYRKIVYFQLPTNAYPIQAVSIARMIQANLRYISSLIQTGQIPRDILVSVIIDEYGSFAEESFVEVLNKARSSGMMVTLAHQSLSDLKHISESFMKRIDENTLNKIYFKQTDPELCELIAKSMGTYRKEEKTYRMTGGQYGNQIHVGESSNKIVNEFHFPPDKIKNLHRFGQGYLISRADNQHRCVNFGRFEEKPHAVYQKRAKAKKKEGLRLFEKYYLKQSPIIEKLVKASPSENEDFLKGIIE
ncbi:MAG TPA: TraM recognition domain-containing protein [Candidatus Omnitrophota bacterium]|nr:TraM recognition domain-containing protein [Candidatus Omnitrophota bacterium]